MKLLTQFFLGKLFYDSQNGFFLIVKRLKNAFPCPICHCPSEHLLLFFFTRLVGHDDDDDDGVGVDDHHHHGVGVDDDHHLGGFHSCVSVWSNDAGHGFSSGSSPTTPNSQGQ